MRNKNFTLHLQTWAVSHGLRPSRRFPCGHGLLGRGLNSDAHEQLCVGERVDLLDHATLFNANKTRLLVAFPYGPRPLETGHETYWLRVNRYANRLGITAYMPFGKNHLHQLYATDTCVVLYGAKGIDLAPFTEGVTKSWVPKPEAFYPRDEHKRAQERARAAARRAERP